MIQIINKQFRYCLIVLALCALPMTSQAQKKSKRTTINFEDQLIKGANQKPDLLYLLQKKQFNYKRLIRLRENFLPEMRATGNEIDEGTKPKLKNLKKKKE